MGGWLGPSAVIASFALHGAALAALRSTELGGGECHDAREIVAPDVVDMPDVEPAPVTAPPARERVIERRAAPKAANARSASRAAPPDRSPTEATPDTSDRGETQTSLPAPPPPPRGNDVAEAGDPLAVGRYLSGMRDRVMAAMTFPRGADHEGTIIVRIVLRGDGSVASVDVAGGDRDGVFRSVALAGVRRAAPFAPLPREFGPGELHTFRIPLHFTIKR